MFLVQTQVGGIVSVVHLQFKHKRVAYFLSFVVHTQDTDACPAVVHASSLSQVVNVTLGNFLFSLHFSLAGNSGHLTWVRLQQLQEQCYPFLTVRAVFSWSKTHKRLKEHFLIRQNRTKRANFQGNPHFQGALLLPPASWHLTDKDKLV